ncbi:amino acid ABC transporter permease [Bacillus sp. EAC]|uniref:amino acid ABC transporter permease n=1 Tax=Bacillus sp. EAC TaxID=1978338 RepID=UPI000B44E80B|nr:amino acid ABC transporter permease [Bacillus sp. EAC]
MNLDFSQIVPSIPYILTGLKLTLSVVICSILLGLVLAILLALMKISRTKWIVLIADFYTSIFRGTPMVLQLMIIYYGLPQIIGFDIEKFPAAVLAFGLNSGAYVSEIIRAGILAVDKGQQEAASALGIPYRKMMSKIILPQAFKNILPALMNEFITLTKESAMVTVIGASDLMRRAFLVGGETYSFMEPLIFVAGIYYIIIMLLSLLGKAVERRLRSND